MFNALPALLYMGRELHGGSSGREGEEERGRWERGVGPGRSKNRKMEIFFIPMDNKYLLRNIPKHLKI
jgi:hypothetical protein